MPPIPRSTPTAEHVDAGGIRSFVDALENTPDVEPHSLMLMRHGSVIAEGWWAPYTAERVHLLYSLSKSFTSTAVGFAVAEGLMSLDDTVLSHFPELDAEITDPRSRAMLVRHVAAMASGHDAETLDRAEALDPVDLVRGFLLIPPDRDPGTVFAYNQPCTFTLAAIVQRASGMSLSEYLRPRLFDPLGIGEVGWLRDASAREIGWSGLHATTEAVAGLGQLYLERGVWEGSSLLDPEWVDDATRAHVDNPNEPNPDWRQGYGFQFWMARHGYRGDGAYGQFCVVLPEYDAVLAITGQSADMQAVLDAAWEHLLPAFDRESTDAADAALAKQLARLKLPAAGGAPDPDTDAVPPADRAATPLTFTPAPGNDQRALTEVTAASAADGSWTIGLLDSGNRIDAAIGIGEWDVTDAIAASGGWHGDALSVEVVFLETPHRMHVVCDRSSGTFTARWETEPLHGPPLSTLRMPRQS